ncbi:MAG: DUF4241 domain-containing protein [Coriobacteriales bacterium]|jgi:hypothetical protein|nr:DUF4241 domain-containing protein [Coriobacteriales bacterium]
MAKAKYLTVLFAPDREAAKQAVLKQLATIAKRKSEPIINKIGDETYQVLLENDVILSVCIFGKIKIRAQRYLMRYAYGHLSWITKDHYKNTMQQIKTSKGVIGCKYESKNTLDKAKTQDLDKLVSRLLIAAALETDGLVETQADGIRNGSNKLVYNYNAYNGQHSANRAKGFDNYFAVNEFMDKKFAKMPLGKLSLPTGKIIVCDALNNLDKADDTVPYTHCVTPGEYGVEAAVAILKKKRPYIAAVRVCFTSAPAVRYKLAKTSEARKRKTNSQLDVSLFLESGLACICDQMTKDAAARALSDYRTADEKNFISTRHYFEYLEAKNTSKKLFNQSGEEVSCRRTDKIFCLDWLIPKTDYRAPIFRADYGDDVYPVWFGFDKAGEVCSLLLGFIDPQEELCGYQPKMIENYIVFALISLAGFLLVVYLEPFLDWLFTYFFQALGWE